MFGYKLVKTKDIREHNSQFTQLQNMLDTASALLRQEGMNQVDVLDILKTISETRNPEIKDTLTARLQGVKSKRIVGFCDESK